MVGRLDLNELEYYLENGADRKQKQKKTLLNLETFYI